MSENMGPTLKMLDLTLHIGGRDQVVEAKQNARYLGVWLDSELSGRAHLDKCRMGDRLECSM